MPANDILNNTCLKCGLLITSTAHVCPQPQSMNQQGQYFYSQLWPTVVNNGIDYERIREIIREEVASALADQKQLEKWTK